MKKILAFIVLMSLPLIAQTHYLVKDFTYGTVFRDSVRYTTLATLTPRNDSIHVLNLGMAYGYGQFTLMASSDTDSLKLSSGIINYNRFGVATDTSYTDEVTMRDSSWTFVLRAVSNTATNKNYTIFPLGQLLKIELINYRASTPARSAHYRFVAFKQSR